MVALYGLGALIAAIVLVLGTAIEPWIAALIVAVVLFAIAGILALTGKKEVEQATPRSSGTGDREHQEGHRRGQAEGG